MQNDLNTPQHTPQLDLNTPQLIQSWVVATIRHGINYFSSLTLASTFVGHRDVQQEQEVVLPNGIRYYDLRVGSGNVPRSGDLVVIDLQGRVAGVACAVRQKPAVAPRQRGRVAGQARGGRRW